MQVQTTFSNGPAIGYAGMLDSDLAHDLVTMIQNEASASIDFGLGVVFDPTPTTDKSAVLPAAITDKLVGIVAHANTYAPAYTDLMTNTTIGGLDVNGVKPGQALNVLRHGRILVKAASGCAPGDKLWVRAIAGGGKAVGSLENANDGVLMIDATANGTWLTTAAAGGLAWLEVNF